MEFSYTCKHCGVSFVTDKRKKQFCTRGCYFASKHHPDVVNTCTVCGKPFTVVFKFRGTKTCSEPCTRVSISQSLAKRVTKQCLACGKDFEVVPSYEEAAKYCSYDPCFLSTRKTRQPDVEKTCEGCGEKFTVSFTRKDQRFCGHSCASSGENNAFYGVTGSAHPMHGQSAWNRGLTAMTDTRVAALGEKVSVSLNAQFQAGRSHVGKNNPNYGRTPLTRTPQQRANYSRAAVQRILTGVSGYKTGHLTGDYVGKKSLSPVRFKSSWELAAMMWWDRDPTVVSYAYEPNVIELADGRRAIPDFFVICHDGSRGYVEVKPTAIQRLPMVLERLEATKRRVEALGFSYSLVGNEEIGAFKASLGKEFIDAVKRYQGGSTDVRGGMLGR